MQLPKTCRTSSKRLLANFNHKVTRLKSEVRAAHEDSKHNMAVHLYVMSVMILDFKVTENELNNEQQVLAVIRSLSDSEWSHSEDINTFSNISCHLELETEHREANHSVALLAHSHKRRGFKLKCEKRGDNVRQKNKNQAPQEGI